MSVRTLSELPSLPRLYGRSLATSRKRRGGSLPDLTIAVEDLRIVPADVAGYIRVCGFSLRNTLPLSYPHVLGFSLQVALMTEPDFPFPLPGLIHVRNQITQARPIGWGERLTVRVHAEGLRPHDKGAQVDMVTRALVDDAVVWSGRSTYLARGEERRRSAEQAHGDTDGLDTDGFDDLSTDVVDSPDTLVAAWKVPADTGRRYAGASGDINPIHLNPVTARLFGFSRPIAHGMWTKAKAIAAFEQLLPEEVTVDVAFDRPVKLPSKVELRSTRTETGREFAVVTSDKGSHLRGRIE